MEQKMFCNQCQEAAGGVGCTHAGVCGKSAQTANLQEQLLYVTKGLCEVTTALRAKQIVISDDVNQMIVENLFATITNANFDDEAIKKQIEETIACRDALYQKSPEGIYSPAVFWNKAIDWSPIWKDQDAEIQSLRQLIVYGLKGLAAYLYHIHAYGKRCSQSDVFLQSALAKLHIGTVEDFLELAMETGKYGVDVMAALDEANTTAYGQPKMTHISLDVRENPAILISGHDLHDLEMLLEQTKGTGVDVYTHGEMLPAHAYPEFQKYEHFVGNYGNAWWKQKEEFEAFGGPILLTTNCLVPPKESYRTRVYTTGVVGFSGCHHISADADGKKDFSPLIAQAKQCPPPKRLENGEILGGFAHHQILELADKVVQAVKTGAIRKFVVMAGCDGRSQQRDYYTQFAQALPEDTVILTAGCAKYKYNKLNLGDIQGIPRVLDAGQCNDSYSLVVVALKLKEVFGLEDINELPIIYNIAWYEQKAVIVLLALLYLGIRKIHLGPTLPAFLSPKVAEILVEQFGIAGIGTVDADIAQFFGA